MTEMISRRLTKAEKTQILDAYRAGGNTNSLAEKYNCTPNTINRTVKTLLSETEYTLLKKNRSKSNKKNDKFINDKTIVEKKEDLEKVNISISFRGKVEENEFGLKVNDESSSDEFDEINPLAPLDVDNLGIDLRARNNENKDDQNNQGFENNFEEIAPLITSFDFDQKNKKLDFEILNYESLPESVYMIVDKKVELDLQPISDLPEWSFLPENELQRNAILLFSNQRSAKRICSRNQRVIKIPNTSIFKLSKPYLISKGITRLILEDSIIGLDD